MPKKPNHADAELILRLYDLRRESEIRKARNWWLTTFWPENADDVVKVGMALGTQENNWLRQVTGYWELAASFVVRVVLNQDLFLEGSFCGEMFFLFAKVSPFLKELREKMGAPSMLGNVEKVITSTKAGRERLKMMEQRHAARRKTMAGAAKA